MGVDRSLKTGIAAPKFRLKALGGGMNSLDEYLAKGPVLLIFFKGACPTCQFTLPYFERMKNGKVQLLAISQDDAESTAEFHDSFRVSLETLLDDEDNGYPVSNAYRITNVPTMFMIGNDGLIGQVTIGFVKRDMEAIGVQCGIAPFRSGDYVPEWKAG